MKLGRHIQQLLFVIVIMLACSAATAQIRFRVAAGLSTDWITNDNPATYRISGSADEVNDSLGFGGGFDGMQMGWGLKGFIDLDKQKRFRIPIGIDYHMFSGAQSVKATSYTITTRHEMDLTTGILGFEWSFVEFPLAYARAFIGGEARVLYVAPNEIHLKVQTRDSTTIDETTNGKPSATRLGAMARLGIEGELYYPVFINTSVAWGVMNLVGRDDRLESEGGRGELLTPRNVNEGGESIVQHLNFTFMIQVRL